MRNGIDARQRQQIGRRTTNEKKALPEYKAIHMNGKWGRKGSSSSINSVIKSDQINEDGRQTGESKTDGNEGG